ncbi:twin-arginine translocation pathway signal protein [Curvibacter sp. HBC28]|uniref:Twin-arginine translocation pathway signal protein n=1 Tax=Curvibacter microcysteis TaxID=3026419 RepID=A0ABT5MMM2_9BURK|nr:YSC84-related protein [Curvibacter sp. HBC28]MDD0817109.1 twin-arginine translocation pathway signal protein [Curvibacter sp. HBC28]
MKLQRRSLPAMLLSAAAAISTPLVAPSAQAATGDDLQRQAQDALASLYKAQAGAAALGQKAKAIMVFPSIFKAGLVFGGAYGEGVLFENQKFNGYYSAVSASVGLQIGAQTFGYAMFVMTDKALASVKESSGWEVGVGPSVVVVDAGLAKRLTTTTLKDDVYAFVFDQNGIMGALGLEGTKVSRIKQP